MISCLHGTTAPVRGDGREYRAGQQSVPLAERLYTAAASMRPPIAFCDPTVGVDRSTCRLGGQFENYKAEFKAVLHRHSILFPIASQLFSQELLARDRVEGGAELLRNSLEFREDKLAHRIGRLCRDRVQQRLAEKDGNLNERERLTDGQNRGENKKILISFES